MNVQTKNFNGKTIRHKDVIYHNVSGCSFSFWDKIKFLLGMKFNISIEIYTMNDQVNIVYSCTTIEMPALIQKKELGGLVHSSSNNNSKQSL